MRDVGAEFVRSPTDRFVADGHAALEQRLPDVAKAELKAGMPAHREVDDRRRKPVITIQRFRFLHHVILAGQPANVAMPPRQIAAGSRHAIQRESAKRAR